MRDDGRVGPGVLGVQAVLPVLIQHHSKRLIEPPEEHMQSINAGSTSKNEPEIQNETFRGVLLS